VAIEAFAQTDGRAGRTRLSAGVLGPAGAQRSGIAQHISGLHRNQAQQASVSMLGSAADVLVTIGGAAGLRAGRSSVVG
jgi:hypothetical protein